MCATKDCFNNEALIRKMEANSFYPKWFPNVFLFFDPDLAEKITEAGRTEMKKLTELFNIKK